MKIVAREGNGLYELGFSEVTSVPGFQGLGELVCDLFGAQIVDKHEGPGERYWDLELSDVTMRLRYEDARGVSLSAAGDSGRDLLQAFELFLETCEPPGSPPARRWQFWRR